LTPGTNELGRQQQMGTATYTWGSQSARKAMNDDAKLDAQMPNSVLSHNRTVASDI